MFDHVTLRVADLSAASSAFTAARRARDRADHEHVEPLGLGELRSHAEVKGFALAASKVVLDGGVGRMLGLARANVRNIPRPSVVG